jgi:hypothetical protein
MKITSGTARAYTIPTDGAHCGPTIHTPGLRGPLFASCRILYDHVRIESMLFDGFRAASSDGCMHPDFTRPGLGITFKQADAERYAQ